MERDWLKAKMFINRWRHMLDRCYDPQNSFYANYGGRGITVCDEWFDFFQYVKDLPTGYFDGAHLDRIDNEGHYTKNNVRWVTARENHNNRRKHVYVEYHGRKQTLSQWAKEFEINRATLNTRLFEWGWSVERAFETPPLTAAERMLLARTKRYEGHVKKTNLTSRTHRQIVYEGQKLTLTELSKICGVPVKLLYKRIFERSWPLEKAIVRKPT